MRSLALVLLLVHSLAGREIDMRWDFVRSGDVKDVGPQTSSGPKLVAVPTAGAACREANRLVWETDGKGIRFANQRDTGNNEGVFLRVSDNPALTGHDGEGTGFSSLRLAVRVRLDAMGRRHCLLRKTQLASEIGYILSVSGTGQVRFAIGTWAGRASVTSGSVQLQMGRWHDVEGIWDKGQLSILVDGKPCAMTARLPGAMPDVSGPLGIGALDRGRGSTGQFLDGTLQTVRIQGTVSDKGDTTMESGAKTTAWGIPVRHMWDCPPISWNAPARGLPLLKGVCHAPIFEPEESEGAYNHHPEIIRHNGRFRVMWSNNMIGEDRAGQRILYSCTQDPTQRPEARLLFPQPGPFFDQRADKEAGGERLGFYMTAMKFIPLGERLFAIASFDSTEKHLVPLARELRDHGTWGEVFALHDHYDHTHEAEFPFPFAPSTDERFREVAERLLKLYLTPQYLPSWNFGIEREFPRPRSVEGTALCEWMTYRTRHGKHVMLARDPRMSHRMYASVSETGKLDSYPPMVPTDIPDTPSKAVTLNLDDGTVLLIGNQLAYEFDNVGKPTHYNRDPLTISISTDGFRFTRQVSLRWEGGRRWRTERRKVPGRGEGGQYPAAMVHDGILYVVYSIGKEDIAVSWVPLERLGLGK